MPGRRHLLALRSLSSLQPRYPLDQSLTAIERLGAGESSRFLDSLRMRSLVVRRLSSVESRSPEIRECSAALWAKVAKLRHMHDVLDANLQRLDKIATEAGFEIFGGKGISAHATYSDQSVRDFNDLDIFVRSRAEATALSRALLREHGYRYQKYELPWFKLDPADGLLYGQIALVAPKDDPDLLNVDVHFGDYSVRHCGRLGIPLVAGSPGLHMVAPEENLACIVNNAAGDYFVTAKDTNDLLMALSLPGFEAGRFAASLRRSHLGGFFGFIAGTLRASSELTGEQERRLSAIPTTRTLEPAPRPDLPSWNRRCVGTTLHAFATRRREGVGHALKVAANGFAYYRKRLSLTAGGGGAAKPITYNPWTCVRLVPIGIALDLLNERPGSSPRMPETTALVGGDPDFHRVDTPEGPYFRIMDEFFVGTVDYDLSPGLIRQAAAAAAEHAG